MKKTFFIYFSILFVVAAVVLGTFAYQESGKVGAQTLSTSAPKYCGGRTATTSPNYLTTGAGTTTVQVSTDRFESATVLLRYFASSTANGLNIPSLHIRRQASNNVGEGDDWYDYDAEYTLTALTNTIGSSTPNMVASSTPTASVIEWRPAGGGATSTVALNLKLLPARFTRFIFSQGSTTDMNTAYRDGGNVYCEITGQASF